MAQSPPPTSPPTSSQSSRYGSPNNPITNSGDLNVAISVKSDGTSIRTNVQPTAAQISDAGKNGYRFAPFSDGRPGGSFKNSNLE